MLPVVRERQKAGPAKGTQAHSGIAALWVGSTAAQLAAEYIPAAYA
jgi:hypothetical protein